MLDISFAKTHTHFFTQLTSWLLLGSIIFCVIENFKYLFTYDIRNIVIFAHDVFTWIMVHSIVILLGHNKFLEPTLIHMMRIDVDHINFQPIMNFLYVMGMWP